MTTKIQFDIHTMALDIAKKHAEITERECKLVCDKFNCQPEDLVMRCYVNTEIKIDVKGSHFKIENVFTYGE